MTGQGRDSERESCDYCDRFCQGVLEPCPETEPVAPPPVEGETRAARVYEENLRVQRGEQRGVEGGRRGGKLGAHLRNAVSVAAMELHQRDVAVGIAQRTLDRHAGSGRTMGDPQASRNYGVRLAEQRNAQKRLTEAQELLTEYERLAASSAVGETRVEWGVRWSKSSGIEEDEAWKPSEAERDRLIALMRAYGYDYIEVCKQTTTTSAWVPVTDKETERD